MKRHSSEHLTADDRAILRGCYSSCPCSGCLMRRSVIDKALRIIDGVEPHCATVEEHVGQATTEVVPKED